MDGVSRAASETGAVSGEAFASAKLLASGSHKLKSELDRFLTMVRVAA